MSVRHALALAAGLAMLTHMAVAQTDSSDGAERPLGAAGPVSSSAERLYAAARPQLLQVRTLVTAAGRQSSIGSGFLVSADGLAITNYHVVSQYALDPANYRLEFIGADGSRGELKLLAFDVANDLAVVRLDGPARPFFRFDARAVKDALPKGERLYSMGNPLDLGFTFVEGTNNGYVDRSYSDRILFSGAINPGMSGGPAVTADGEIAGINVAKRLDGELVSFLVPPRFAAALIERAGEAPSAKDLEAEIARQLGAAQTRLYTAFEAAGFRPAKLGPYEAPESAAPWFTCWARTNAGQAVKPRASVNATACNSDTRIFLANDLQVGHIQTSHAYVRSIDLNAFQFASFLSQQSQPAQIAASKWRTDQHCHQDFVAGSTAEGEPPLLVLWCARAYRKFDGLYDFWIVAVTQDRDLEALVSRLSLQGVAYDNAVAMTRRFLAGIRWSR
jgi:hypothetical protein